jgi:hypothetical protein
MSVLEKFTHAIHGGLAGLATVGAAVAGAFVGIVTQTALEADEIGDMAEKLGITTDALQELKYAANQSDVSFESLSTGLKFLSKNAVEAAQGSEEAQKAFAGINTRKANGEFKSADELLDSVVDKFQKVPEGIAQTNLAIKIFGRSGIDMVPLLKKGAAGIAAFRKEAHDLGVVMDKETIEAGSRFDQQLKRSKAALEGLKNTFATPFIGVFAKGLEKLADWLKSNRANMAALSKAFQDVGERLAGMGEMFLQAIGWFTALFGDSAIAKILKGADYLKIVEMGLIGLGVAGAASGLMTLASWLLAAAPFILLGVLIGFIVDELYNFIAGNDNLISRIIQWADFFDPNDNPILNFFKEAISLLFDLTDPAKFDRFIDGFYKAIGYLQTAFSEFVSWLAGVIVEWAPKIWQGLLDGIKGLPGALLTGLKDIGGMASTLAEGFGGQTHNLEAGRMAYSGGASGPNAAAEISTGGKRGASVKQTNTININGSNLNEEQLKRAVLGAHQELMSDAHAAVGG